jgi:hypothetical protein
MPGQPGRARRPARRRGRLGAQVDGGDAQGLASDGLPVGGLDQPGEAVAAAAAEAARFAAAVLLDDHRDVEPGHRPRLGEAQALGAEDLDLLHRGGERDGDLDDAGVGRAQESVDLAQDVDLGRERRVVERVVVGVEALVGRPRRRGEHVAAGADGEAGGLGGAGQRGLGDFGRMGVAGGLAAHRAQAEAFGGVVARGLEPAVVEHEALRAPALEKELAVVGAGHGLLQDCGGTGLVEVGLERAKTRGWG